MITPLQILLAACLSVGSGNFKEREAYTHKLKNSTISFQEVKQVYRIVDDPETKIRLKEIAYFKYCIETDNKYRVIDYYQNNTKVDRELQKKDFLWDLYRGK